jgi:hypothetical protein
VITILETAAPRSRKSALDGVENKDREDRDDLDRLLGDRALFTLKEASETLRISPPSLYRAMRLSRIPYVMNGNRRMFTRSVMKHLLREGVGRLAGKFI